MKRDTYKKLKHLISVVIIFLFPIIIEDNDITCCEYFMSFGVIASYLIIFYLNYYIFIDKWLNKRGKKGFYMLINLLVVTALWLILEYWRNEHFVRHIIPTELLSQMPPPPSKWLMAMKDLWIGVMVIGLSIALRVSENYYKLKEQTNELIRLKSESELAELKHQINPHFLFNTLNNIYALIDISQIQAQNAILGLSRMLRYVLYDGNHEKVLLEDDLQFVRNYVDLMSLRVSENTNVSAHIPKDDSNLYIAPMLFISLIENAFKHGISGHASSYIDVGITVQEGTDVVCVVKNSVSNLRNNIVDKSGIGLDNLRKRLELIYPGNYYYTVINQDGEYMAELKIRLKDEKA